MKTPNITNINLYEQGPKVKAKIIGIDSEGNPFRLSRTYDSRASAISGSFGTALTRAPNSGTRFISEPPEGARRVDIRSLLKRV